MVDIKTEKKDTIKDTVYKELMTIICTGQLTADVIITETQLIERFSVSKAPVREALVQLCHEGVLESLPRLGYRLLAISPKNIRDSTELRMMLELGSIPAVIKELDKSKMDVLRAINDERKLLISTDKNMWALWDNNIRFHLKLISFTGNTQVHKALERTLSTFTRAYAQEFVVHGAMMYPNNSSPARHDYIISALEAHDLFDTYEFIKRDILYLQQLLLEVR